MAIRGLTDNVKLLLLAVGNNALLCEFLNRRAKLGIDVDNVDIVPIEDLVVVLLQAWPLDAERVRLLCWEEHFLFLLILDSL